MSTASQATSFRLGAITNKPRKLPNRVILHAKAGWGKTSFAAQVPGAVFLMVAEETGLLTLIDSGQVPEGVNYFPHSAVSKKDIEAALDELTNQDHSYKALVVDSITMLERALQSKVCDEKYGSDWQAFNLFGGEESGKVVAAEWDSILRRLDWLRERGVGTFLIAHSDVVKFKNPSGLDYDRWVPAIGKHSWKKLFNWSDMALFGDFETRVESKDKKASKGKATGGQKRILCCEHHAAYDAKNRHGLPEEIDCGESAGEAWANFRQALTKQK